ncbi:MAG TPA: cytochrome c peroxidase [Pseudolabrys sp.]|nr:cytochrome c peroxidase [Pseudolabrys sp.]
MTRALQYRFVGAGFLASLLLCGAHSLALADPAAAPLTRAQAYERAAAMSALGRKLFNDPTLSASGQMACATCHSPEHAFGPPNGEPVQYGGKDMKQPGLRAVPSLRYLQVVPQFTEHYFEPEDDGDESIDNGPAGGLTWDGRVDRGRDQASVPLLSPYEMANERGADVVGKVRKAAYAGDLRKIFGATIFEDDDKAFKAVVQALEVYEQSERDFYPYSSKYDAYLAGKAKLSAQEARGLALFKDETKGNCSTCHRSEPDNDGTPPQFTDFGMIAIGVPRNNAIPANADPNYFDLGLCGPLRTDLRGRPEYCGLFRTPSLRNVALRKTFFHNGQTHSLRDAVAFYVERDINPGKWYPRNPDGSIRKYDDLPAAYQGNINNEPPFGQKPGEKPRLSDAEIDDIVAFLRTLTDGYAPGR